MPISMFEEHFPCTAGLEQPSSKLFYNDKVERGLCTKLAEEEKSQDKYLIFLNDHMLFVSPTTSAEHAPVANGAILPVAAPYGTVRTIPTI